MIWQEGVQHIAMLANIQEGGKVSKNPYVRYHFIGVTQLEKSRKVLARQARNFAFSRHHGLLHFERNVRRLRAPQVPSRLQR